MTYNIQDFTIKNPNDLVEVNLSWDVRANIPYADEEGRLRFQNEQITPDAAELIVKLPKEVVDDKEKLTDYLHNLHESYGDLPSYTNINIWDEDKEHPTGGTFRFGMNDDGSKSGDWEEITADWLITKSKQVYPKLNN